MLITRGNNLPQERAHKIVNQYQIVIPGSIYTISSLNLGIYYIYIYIHTIYAYVYMLNYIFMYVYTHTIYVYVSTVYLVN